VTALPSAPQISEPDARSCSDHSRLGQRPYRDLGAQLSYPPIKILGRPSQLVERAARLLGLSSRPIHRLLRLGAFRQIR
jgi:hypothetical protein